MLIGRIAEQKRLREAYESDASEFIAVYGRRRVGKTYLVRETFDNRFAFYYTGRYKISSKKQIESFSLALKEYGLEEKRKPETWLECFSLLKILIEKKGPGKKVIFLDELPWMASPGSDFLSCFEYFWNSWASSRNDILMIICGSASSWIINKIFKNKGGLHNRVTGRISLKPFTLHEVELLAKHKNLGYSRNNLMEGYMAIGGIPFYWSRFSKEKSLSANINDLFFSEEGEFHNEYRDLYDSLFHNPEKYKAIIEALAGKKKGLTRGEILAASKLENNGRFSTMLEDLIECGFIRKYCDLGKKVKDATYQLIDFYTLFYFSFLRNAVNKDENYWNYLQSTHEYSTWTGIAFEKLCMVHSRQIKRAMGISGIISNIFSWSYKGDAELPGVQIDLLFDRSDNIFSLFEMKYAPAGYRITESEVKKIHTRKEVFEKKTKTRKGVQIVLVTSNGIENPRMADGINCFLEGKDLFED